MKNYSSIVYTVSGGKIQPASFNSETVGNLFLFNHEYNKIIGCINGFGHPYGGGKGEFGGFDQAYPIPD